VHWVQDPLNATLTVLTLAVSFWHMHSGMRVVVEDYIHKTLTRSALLLINLFVCGLAGALAVFSILKVALGAGILGGA
jgi:succinate dehydrogenase / fumarate reductase membrane anchor subunit